MSHLGGGVDATVTLWKRCGVKVVPGAYLSQPNREGVNPGERYVRVALVHPVGHDQGGARACRISQGVSVFRVDVMDGSDMSRSRCFQ